MTITGWEIATRDIPGHIADRYKAAAMSALKRAGASDETTAHAYGTNAGAYHKILVTCQINGHTYDWADTFTAKPA